MSSFLTLLVLALSEERTTFQRLYRGIQVEQPVASSGSPTTRSCPPLQGVQASSKARASVMAAAGRPGSFAYTLVVPVFVSATSMR